MHILATFATLCCQTRWPRNHSCTTQEHVSFFRTFSGTRQKPTGQNRTFSEISTFSTFSQKPSKSEKTVRMLQKMIFHVRACSQKQIHKCTHVEKTFHACTTILQMCKCVKCKSANVRKTDVHKMRKSAAQIFFQMQKSQICKSANSHNSHFRLCKFCCVKVFLLKYFLILM